MMRDFVVVGLSHRTAPVEVREQLAVAPQNLERELRELARDAGFEEALLISTCNRVELYATSANPLQAAQDAKQMFSKRLGGAARVETCPVAHRVNMRRASRVRGDTGAVQTTANGHRGSL